MRDEEIIERFQVRDEVAIEALQQKYGAYCQAIAGRILYSQEDCEECVNDTWSKAWNSIPPEQPKNLKLYLAAITRNLALNSYSRQSAQKRGGTEIAAVFDELSECIVSGDTPEDTVMHKELSAAVNKFLKDLPSRERDIFLRRYFFSEGTKIIAKRYGLKESHVLVILSRTRKKLKKFLQKEDYLL